MKINIEVEEKAVRVLGWDKAIIVQYILENKDEDGWTVLSKNEHAMDKALCLFSRPRMYYHLDSLTKDGYLEKVAVRFSYSKFRLTTIGKALFKEAM